MYNAFKLTKQLEEVGFSREQAELQIQVISEIIEADLATKQDLNQLKLELEHRMDTLENRLTIKLGAMMVIGFTSMITLLKVWGIH